MTKHVESLLIPRLDEGSSPSISTTAPDAGQHLQLAARPQAACQLHTKATNTQNNNTMNAKTFMAVMLALIAVFASASAKEPKRPETYNYNRGIEAYNDDNLDQAAEYFSREISENPKNSGYANTWLAYVYYAQKQYGWALNSATQAIKDLPSSDKLYKVLSLNERALIYTALEIPQKPSTTSRSPSKLTLNTHRHTISEANSCTRWAGMPNRTRTMRQS